MREHFLFFPDLKGRKFNYLTIKYDVSIEIFMDTIY